MKKFFPACFILILWSCSGTEIRQSSDIDPQLPTADNSQTSLDWPGTYKGILPCADCAGIGMEINLQKDNTYTMSMAYWGKSDPHFRHEGSFQWDGSGGIITLKGLEDEASNQFRVGENVLIKLDREGKAISGDLEQAYRLVKTEFANDIRSVYWKLVEINGQAISEKWGKGREPHLIFDMAENKVYGSGGCNRFFGSYELMEGQRISFSPMGTTRMACENMEVERALLEIFEKTDNYSVAGNRLSLQKARMAPAAVFEAVYRP